MQGVHACSLSGGDGAGHQPLGYSRGSLSRKHMHGQVRRELASKLCHHTRQHLAGLAEHPDAAVGRPAHPFGRVPIPSSSACCHWRMHARRGMIEVGIHAILVKVSLGSPTPLASWVSGCAACSLPSQDRPMGHVMHAQRVHGAVTWVITRKPHASGDDAPGTSGQNSMDMQGAHP